MIDLHVGDCLDVLHGLDLLADTVVTDPPAAIRFMGRAWDDDRGGRGPWVAWLAERLAAARAKTKPGGWALIWALPRTAHWTGCAVEDAGWRVVDVVHHAFGQGWPKNRSLLKPSHEHWILAQNGTGCELQIDAGRVRRDWSERGEAWLRSGHSAKPEAMKIGGAPPGNGINANPLGSWPPNTVLSHCVECEEAGTRQVKGSGAFAGPARSGAGASQARGAFKGTDSAPAYYGAEQDVSAWNCLAGCLACGASTLSPAGGPAPRCACGAAMVWACPVAEIDAQSGYLHAPGNIKPAMRGLGYGGGKGALSAPRGREEGGGASRFFPCLPGDILRYHAKAPPGERQAGCEGLLWRANNDNPFGYDLIDRAAYDALPEDERATGNVHPTVKRISLLERLCALASPIGGTVLDLFEGSGGTAIACHRLGFHHVGIDAAPEALAIARARIAWWRAVRLDVRPKKATAARTAAPSAASQPSLFDLTTTGSSR